MHTESNTVPKHTNRLVNETSPYLLQHAHNPVDWQPWDDEALQQARKEDKPIFLSIGYSACHWCHVMEHESFEDDEVAAILNAHFVSIKVDREERPDLDDIYMKAVQLMTGSGGWPMSVFLTPDLQPFYGGAYYPPRDMMGRPSFKTVLKGVSRAWDERRDEIANTAAEMVRHIQAIDGDAGGAADLPSPELIRRAAADLASTFDSRYGGFGSAPKFPSGPTNQVLLRDYWRNGVEESRRMAEHTLQFMYFGGMCDHLGGGFHRYSVDEQWLVPHFEKMLYDNAQLAEVYTEAWQLTKNPLYRKVAEDIFAYELRDMRDPGGAFHSTEDADSEGEEGRFYLWTHDALVAELGKEDAAVFCDYYGVRPEGNFQSHEPYHQGMNILHIAGPPQSVAERHGMTLDELESRLDKMRQKLFAVREERVRPGLDDKILTSWNALLIGALAKGARAFGRNEYKDAAEEAARFILDEMRDGDRLLRTHRGGRSRLPAYLDDYAFLCDAFVDLYQATFNTDWLREAERLADALIERFWDNASGGFYFTSSDHDGLIVRSKPFFDGSEPSGNSVAALGLLRLARLTGKSEYQEKAEATLRAARAQLEHMPRAFMNMLFAVDLAMHPSREVAIIGAKESPETAALLDVVNTRFLPDTVVALRDPSQTQADQISVQIPLLAEREPSNGKPTVYVCRNYTCERPVTSPDEAAALLDDAE